MSIGSNDTTGVEGPRVFGLRAEHHSQPFGVGEDRPRLSWKLQPGDYGSQVAYEISLTRGRESWSSTRVESPDSLLVPWSAPPLSSREHVTARVRIWTEFSDKPSPWSAPLDIEAGLLRATDWTARLIAPGALTEATGLDYVGYLRREFELKDAPESARLYATAHGVYEVEINGCRVGDHVLAPGWTSYRHHLHYQTYDVTDYLIAGSNVIGATLADGWFRGRLGFESKRNIWGQRMGLFLQLEIHGAGGIEAITSDRYWRSSTGAIESASLYDGERFDFGRAEQHWSEGDFDDDTWEPVDVLEFDVSVLRAPKGPPIRRCETLAPASITGAPNDGRYLVDFGQNLTGRVRLSTDGMGSTVTIRHAEVLEHGELCTRPLRTADATDVVTFGHGRQSYEPRYTLHGFRYAEVRGLPGPLHPSAIEAVACHTDLERVGWFSCSNELVNRLHENVVWGIRSNFVGVPTDCPQRDERLGWTGDIQIIAPTASFLYNCTGMLTSWLEDLQAEQDSHGLVPLVVPDVLGYCAPMAAWGDAAVIVPMTLFERTGDVDILRRQFNSMSAWVDGLVTFRGDRLIWDDGWQLGDWLDPSAPSDNAAAGKTDRTLVAAAYFVRSAALVSKAAKILGMHEQALRYGDVAARVRHAFQREFVTPVGRVASDSQTAYAMAIAFDLLEPDQCIMAGQRLADLVRDAHSHIGTGFIGAPLLCDALCTTGHTESAYGILLQTTCPSFLYPVTMGATTMWERWDALLPDGSVNPGKMTSFNHYAFGAIADWLHRTVAGLAPGSPGYRRIDVHPQPGGHLNSASATHDTPYGTAAVAWERHRRRFHLSVDVPSGSVADIVLPDGTARGVGPGSHSFVCEFRAPEDDPEEEPSKLDRWLDPA